MTSNIGRRIQTLREELHLTQRELADKCGVSQSTIAEWETKNHAPRFNRLPKIAKALKTTVEQLVAAA